MAAFFANWFMNGQVTVFELLTLSLPQLLHLQLFPQLHSPSLQQHSPPLLQSHLAFVLCVQFLSHVHFVPHDSAGLQQFESLQHLPSLQQSSIEQVIFTQQHLPRRSTSGFKPMQPFFGVVGVCAQTTFPNRVVSAAMSAACQ